MTEPDYVAEHRRQIETNAKRKVLAEKLAPLMTRVIALKDKPYPGYVFHWSTMKTAGRLIGRVFNYDETYKWHDLLSDEVAYEVLLEDVEQAEAALKPTVESSELSTPT